MEYAFEGMLALDRLASSDADSAYIVYGQFFQPMLFGRSDFVKRRRRAPADHHGAVSLALEADAALLVPVSQAIRPTGFPFRLAPSFDRKKIPPGVKVGNCATSAANERHASEDLETEDDIGAVRGERVFAVL